jgi:protein-L-isoaspartate(D-aspartate) O-methyltransferase
MNIELARFNMIEQQIRPWDVLDADVLELLARIKREDFVPEAYRSLAFSDIEVPIAVAGKSTGESMLSPKLEARMLQDVAPRKHESVLEIGAGTGYMAALLSHRAREVLSLDIRNDLAQLAQANLRGAGITNAKAEVGDGAKLTSSFHPNGFDVIVLSGSVAQVPENLLNLLKVGGRLIGIVGQAPVMSAQLVTRQAEHQFVAKKLFDTGAKPLVGFPIGSQFQF